MEENDWILLAAIGEGKTMSQASKELFISQPALTYRINKIEEEFGSKLFVRDNKGIKPNPQGEYLIQYAKRMTKELQYVKEKVLSLGSQTKGKLYIGASNAIAQYILPNLLSKFLAYYPEVEPHVITGFSPYLIDKLSKEDIHIAFLREDIEWLYTKKLLKKENVYIVSRDNINLEDLPNLPRIDYKTNQSLQMLIDLWWAKHFQTPPNIIARVDNADVGLEFVRSGLGYAILTELGLSKETALHRIPITHPEGYAMQRDTWLYGSKNSEQFLTVKTFFQFMIDEQPFD